MKHTKILDKNIQKNLIIKKCIIDVYYTIEYTRVCGRSYTSA